MSTVMQLTERERSEVRKRVLEQYRSDTDTILEAMNDCHDWHAALVIDDPYELAKQINKVLSLYLEKCGLYEQAEADELNAISRGEF